MKVLKNIKKLNHIWCCSDDKCTCDSINIDSPDLGNRIIQEMWNKEVRYVNSKNGGEKSTTNKLKE